MSVTIKNFEIINNGASVNIWLETNIGSAITSISLWTMDDFKNYSKAINLNSYIEGVSNVENIIVNAIDVGLDKFVNIIFIEVTDNYVPVEPCTNCTNPALGITYNLAPYYHCLMTNLLALNLIWCNNCNNDESKQKVITINMLIDTIPKAIDIGYYTQAIDMVHKLESLCKLSLCKNCPQVFCASCNNFIQI